MNLQQLKYFVVLAEVGHFGHTAEKLYITQPALSNSIKGLEREVGSELFERTGRKVVLTQYGIRFYAHIVKALGEIQRATDIPAPPQKNNPSVRIATVASTQQSFLPSLLVDYARTTHKSLDFDIVDARTSPDCIKMVEEGASDLAFCGRPTTSGSGAWVPVLAQKLVVAVSVEHELADIECVSLNDLLDYPLISYRRPSSLYYPVKALTDAMGVQFQEGFNNEIGAFSYIAANTQCVALLLDTLGGEIRTKISVRPIKELKNPFHIVGMYYSPRALANEDVALFVEYNEERFADLQQVIPIELLLVGQA